MGRGRRRNRIGKWVKRHPLIVLTLLFSVGTGMLTDHFLHVTGAVQGYVSLSTPVFVFVVYCLACNGYGAIYIIIGLHPTTGRLSCAYVGLTTQRPYTDASGTVHYPRLDQHLRGSDYYGVSADLWADLVVRWYFAHESYRMIGVRKRAGRRGEAGPFLRFLEWFHIKLRRPLYNYQHNGTNRRQIPKWIAAEQRNQRDMATRGRQSNHD